MSTLWTPGGERDAGDADDMATTGEEQPSEEELAAAREHLEQVRSELAATPARDIVANHAIGLWQLAVLHLGVDREDAEPQLEEAKLAIDAMAALVEGLADRLGDHAEPLRAALSDVQLAFVRLSTPE